MCVLHNFSTFPIYIQTIFGNNNNDKKVYSLMILQNVSSKERLAMQFQLQWGEREGGKILERSFICLGGGPAPGGSVDEPMSDLKSLVFNLRHYPETPFGTIFWLLTRVLLVYCSFFAIISNSKLSLPSLHVYVCVSGFTTSNSAFSIYNDIM